MKKPIKLLMAYLVKNNKKELSIKVGQLAFRTESIAVDLWELESLVNQDKFEFDNPEIERVTV